MLESYLDELRAQLSRLPAADVADVVDECRDHLLSHADDLVGHGQHPATAMSSALRSFGTGASVVDGLRGELHRAALRRLSRLLLFSGPLLAVSWRAVVVLGPPAPWRDDAQPRLVGTFDIAGLCTATVAVLLAGLGLALLVLPTRAGVPAGTRTRCQRWASVGLVGAVGFGGLATLQTVGYLIARGAIDAHSVAWGPVAALAVLTLALAALFTRPLRAVAALHRAR
jgi:hypothetical protein